MRSALRSAATLVLMLGAAALAGCQSQPLQTERAAPVAEAFLPAAHSHNDYEQARPLATALELGFGSIEADIFLVDGELLVAHNRADCRPERTLRAMYLAPLAERSRSRGGRIYAGSDGTVTLLVDIKADGEAAYAELDRQLRAYGDVFSSVIDGVATRRAVDVVISGAVPRDTIAAQGSRYAFIDGREGDLRAERPLRRTLVPLVSMPWGEHVAWDGAGRAPESALGSLRKLAEAAHTRGYRLRFWGAPATEAAWAAQSEIGIDVIGFDDLARGAAFLRAR
jgi:hypothetical protein